MDGAHLVLFKDGSRQEVFLVKRNDVPIWQTTAGAIEPGETPEEAALREAKEETGFEVELIRKVAELKLKNIFGKIYGTQYVFEGRITSGKYRPEFEGCEGSWFNIDNLHADTGGNAKEVFKTIRNKTEDGVKIRRFYYNPLLWNLHIFFKYPIATTQMFLKKFSN